TGAQSQAKSGTHVVAGTGGHKSTLFGTADLFCWCGDPRNVDLTPEGVGEQVGSVGVLGGGPVAGAGGVAAVGGGGLGAAGQFPGEPVVGEQYAAYSCCGLVLLVCEPAQFGDGHAGGGNGADGFGPGLRSAEFEDQVAGGPGGAVVVPQQGGTDHFTVLVHGHHAVLLAGDRDGGHVVEQAAACFGQRRPPRMWVDLGPVGVCGTGLAYEGTGLGVADHDFARLGRTVDPGDQGHGVVLQCVGVVIPHNLGHTTWPEKLSGRFPEAGEGWRWWLEVIAPCGGLFGGSCCVEGELAVSKGVVDSTHLEK